MGEQCGSVANFVKGTIAKIANLPQSLQSSHSPTAILRILYEIKNFDCHCERCLHRVAKQGEAAASLVIHFHTRIHFLFMDRRAACAARDDDKKADSRKKQKRKKSRFFNNSQAAGFLMRKLCFTSAGVGIYLVDNEQARAK